MRRKFLVPIGFALLGATAALTDSPASQPATTQRASTTAPLVQTGYAQPEDAVLAMLIAMSKKDRAALEAAVLPNKDLAVLLEGEQLSAATQKAMVAQIEKMPMRRAKLGEKVEIKTRKGLVELVFDENYINEDRQQIIMTGDPVPTTVVRGEDGRWRADAGKFIAARKAVAVYKATHPEKNASTQKNATTEPVTK